MVKRFGGGDFSKPPWGGLPDKFEGYKAPGPDPSDAESAGAGAEETPKEEDVPSIDNNATIDIGHTIVEPTETRLDL